MKMQILKMGIISRKKLSKQFFAYKEINKVKEAYNRSSYKDDMRGLIKWYEIYLEKIIQ